MLLFSDDILRGTKCMGVGLRPGHRSQGLNRFTVALTLHSMGQTWSQCSAGIFCCCCTFPIEKQNPKYKYSQVHTRVKKKSFFFAQVFFWGGTTANFKEKGFWWVGLMVPYDVIDLPACLRNNTGAIENKWGKRPLLRKSGVINEVKIRLE